ncbi:hypothetical protein ACFYTF_21900 [Nocardia thailandica]|uniref:Lipoprotein n=1 Tax=Nocardia thailandica TaxID=257275 RepID=A0ABW6PTG9_9NOCA
MRQWIRGTTALLAGAGLLLFAAGCGAPAPDETPAQTAPQSLGAVRYALRTTAGMAAVTADGTVAGRDGQYRSVGFSRDNSLIWAVDEQGGVSALETDSLLVASGRFDCGCTAVFPLHDAVVGWWAGPDRIMQADLRDPKPTVLRAVALPEPRDPVEAGNTLTGTTLLALTDRLAVLARTESAPGASWGYSHVYTVDTATGAVRQFGRVGTINTPLSAAVVAPDGSAVAVKGYDRDNAACGVGAIYRIDLATGRVDGTAPPLPSCSSVADLRWDTTGLAATRLTWHRDDPSALTGSTVWRYGPDGWTQVGDDTTLRAVTLADGTDLRVRRTGAASPFGTLAGELNAPTDPVQRSVIDVARPY